MNDYIDNSAPQKDTPNFITNTIKSKNTAIYLFVIGLLVVFSRGCQKEIVVVNGCAIQPNTVCIDANLEDLDLSGANLSGANLSGSSLIRTNLKRANLKGAILSGTTIALGNVYRTNFKNSYIYNSKISGENIEKATLQGALLCYVNFGDEDIGIDSNKDCENYNKLFKNPHQTREYFIEAPLSR